MEDKWEEIIGFNNLTSEWGIAGNSEIVLVVLSF